MTKEEFDKKVEAIVWSKIGSRSELIDQLWADIEADRGVVIPPEEWEKRPWATFAKVCLCTKDTPPHSDRVGDVVATIPRPAPVYRELSTKEKVDAWLEFYRKKYAENGRDVLISILTNGCTIDDACKSDGIETRVRV